jgi:tetratricopeptide (TPR) repeat protein
MLEKKKKEYTDALDAINKAKAEIETANSEGLPGDDAKKKLESANEALSKMEYLSVIELTKECVNQIKKVRELKANAEKIIEEAEKAIEDARAEKVDVSAAEKAIVSAKNALSSGNYTAALETGKKVKTDAEIRLKSFKGANEEIANARKSIEEIMELGGDAAKVTELLGQAQNVLKTDVVKGYELAKSCAEKATRQKQALSYVKTCKTRIDALQQKGTDVSKLSNVLWLADSFMRKGEFDKVINYAQKLEKLIENLEKQ